MKNTFLLILVISLATFISCAQSGNEKIIGDPSKEIKTFDKVNTDTQKQLSQLLDSYLRIKDALASDNKNAANAAAAIMLKDLGAVNMKIMTVEQHTFFMELNEKMNSDVSQIASLKSMEAMRTHFESLSNTVYSMVKTFHLYDSGPVYQQYCPMKKVYWLSKEQIIKNPYYGKEMLSCGKLTETLK